MMRNASRLRPSVRHRALRTRLRFARALLGFAFVLAAARTEAATEKPAASVHDLRDYFAGCFQPPSLAANTRVTFYFSMNNRGGLIGQPRTTWLGYAGDTAERDKELARFTAAFDKCLPVSLDRGLAASIPGEVYYLQYVVGPDGHDQQVLMRPFGSHGGVGPLIVEPHVGPLPEPAEEVGPTPSPFRAFRPRPYGPPFFRQPVGPPHGRIFRRFRYR